MRHGEGRLRRGRRLWCGLGVSVLATAFLASVLFAADGGYAPPTERWSDAKVFIARPGAQPGGPWTPMAVEKTAYRGNPGIAVSCWGRQYIFTGASVLPTQIISQGQELLSAPIMLAGPSIPSASFTPELPAVSIGPLSGDDERVMFQAVAGPLKAEITIEFDGYLWADVSLAGTGSLDKADLVIPMTAAAAKYYNFGESGWDLARSGVVGGEGWGWSSLRGASDKYVDEAGTFTSKLSARGGWQPIVSLCSDQAGLSWFAEDYRNWTGRKDITIMHKGDGVAMQIGIVGEPAKLPLNFSFGLQAVPLKPLPAWHYSQKRIFCETDLKQLDETGKGWGTFPHFFTGGGTETEPYFSYYPFPKTPEVFHKYLAECHARGLQVLHYLTTHYVSETIPEFRPDWQVFPVKRIGPYVGTMAAGMCPNTEWRNFWAEKIVRKTLELYPELDGLYFDCTTPMGCSSADHGCAPFCFQWRAEREMIEKAWVLVKNRPQGGIIQLHSSGFRWVTPCFSFADVRLSGEFLDHNVDDEANAYHPRNKQPTFPPNEANLAKFRSTMEPHSWGIPITMLSYDRDAAIQAILDKKTKGDPTTGQGHRFGNPNESAAWFAIHDSCVQPTIADHFRYGGMPYTCFITRDIWDILQNFGATYQNWCGYWHDPAPATVTGTNAEMVRVSAYLKKGNEALLVIGNLGREAAQAQITLNADVLGLPAGQWKAADVDKGDWLVCGPVAQQGNTLSLDLAGTKSKGSLRFIKISKQP